MILNCLKNRPFLVSSESAGSILDLDLSASFVEVDVEMLHPHLPLNGFAMPAYSFEEGCPLGPSRGAVCGHCNWSSTSCGCRTILLALDDCTTPRVVTLCRLMCHI